MKKKILKPIVVAIALTIIISGYWVTRKSSSESLDSWLGDYELMDKDSPHSTHGYNLYIFKENYKYYAEVDVNTGRYIFRVKATVSGNSEQIEIRFLSELLPEARRYPAESLSKGDVLWEFTREPTQINTKWVNAVWSSEDNSDSNSVFFYHWPQIIPEWIDKAENILIDQIPSLNNKHIAYVYSSYNAKLDEKLYLLTILKKGEAFHFQPANIYASKKLFTVSCVEPYNDWMFEIFRIHNREVNRLEILKYRSYFDGVDILSYASPSPTYDITKE